MIIRLGVLIVFIVAAVLVARYERERQWREARRAMLQGREERCAMLRELDARMTEAFVALVPAMQKATEAFVAFGEAWTKTEEDR